MHSIAITAVLICLFIAVWATIHWVDMIVKELREIKTRMRAIEYVMAKVAKNQSTMTDILESQEVLLRDLETNLVNLTAQSAVNGEKE